MIYRRLLPWNWFRSSEAFDHIRWPDDGQYFRVYLAPRIGIDAKVLKKVLKKHVCPHVLTTYKGRMFLEDPLTLLERLIEYSGRGLNTCIMQGGNVEELSNNEKFLKCFEISAQYVGNLAQAVPHDLQVRYFRSEFGESCPACNSSSYYPILLNSEYVSCDECGEVLMDSDIPSASEIVSEVNSMDKE